MLDKKQHYNQEFYHLISAIRKTMDRNREVLLFKTRGSHSKILQLLMNEGLIISFQSYKGFITVRVRHADRTESNQRGFNLIELAERIGRKNCTISLLELELLQRRQGGAVYYILNTDKGLLTSFKAIEKCVGGDLLLRIA